MAMMVGGKPDLTLEEMQEKMTQSIIDESKLTFNVIQSNINQTKTRIKNRVFFRSWGKHKDGYIVLSYRPGNVGIVRKILGQKIVEQYKVNILDLDEYVKTNHLTEYVLT